MFTGLIEEVSLLVNKIPQQNGMRLEIEATEVMKEARLGASIAVNGICLTVVEIGNRFFAVEAVKETLENTTIPFWQLPEPLNLERALAVGDRMGGHFVQGHIDGIGTIYSINRSEIETRIMINCSSEIMRYIVRKGPIAVDGISLTVAEIDSEDFSIAIIPYTWENTNLHFRKIGDKVNLETDVLAKYVEKMSYSREIKSQITEETLRQAGF
jgi:riboflavin synthase